MVLVVGVQKMRMWDLCHGFGSRMYFSFQSLKSHTEINQMSFGDVEWSDLTQIFCEGTWGMSKNCQLSEYLLVIMLFSSEFPLVLSLIVS